MTEHLLPVYYIDRCTGCGLCVAVCLTGVLEVNEGRAVFVRPQVCTYCGECEMACPSEAVELYYEIYDISDAGNPAASDA